MESGATLPWGSLKFRTGSDFIRLEDGYDIQSAIEGAYSQEGLSETILITRSNKRAGAFNTQIRSRVLLSEGEIAAGDLLMVVKNNYFWVDENSPCGFIANGDLAEVMSVRREIELYGMRFARVELSLTDYPQMPKFEALILLDTLYSQAPALPEERARAFFEQVMLDYEDLPPRKRFEALAKNEYYNAIQVKFGLRRYLSQSPGRRLGQRTDRTSLDARAETLAGIPPLALHRHHPRPETGVPHRISRRIFRVSPGPTSAGKTRFSSRNHAFSYK